MTLKVFIADDSTTIQKIVTLAFGCEDATVECASDGESALDVVRALKPDVVLADIFMPGYSGYEICERMKEDPALADIPVILLTGTFEPFDESEAARVRCDGHLTKPFDTAELIDTVHALAEKRTMGHQSDNSVETSGMDMQIKAALSPASPRVSRGSVSAQVWESYLGAERILELFDTGTLRGAEAMQAATGAGNAISGSVNAYKERLSSVSGEELSEQAIDLIANRVMRRMAADVIREVAWEVVPELSENIIRRTLAEQNKP